VSVYFAASLAEKAEVHDRIGRVIVERISRFIQTPAAPDTDSFEELALAAFAFQHERIAPYRRLCEGRGVDPSTLTDWRQIPPVPAAAFKTLELAAAPAVEVFRSSGTSSATEGAAEVRGVHHHPFPDLYRTVIDASFPRFCLPHLAVHQIPGQAEPRLPILSLIPTREQLPDSSLSFMADHVIARYGTPESAVPFGPRGVEVAKTRSWLGGRQREGKPVLILATSFALAQWLDGLERMELRFRLPPGSVIFDTGGFKGKTAEVSREDLLQRIAVQLGVPASQVVREYGMTELTSQCYTRALYGEDPELFVAPAWVRVRILDPETLEEVPAGTPGLISVFDLANVGSAVHLLTEDLGVADGLGFRLRGRAAGAELRGCSLVVEELRG
jgi:hypothetical protein